MLVTLSETLQKRPQDCLEPNSPSQTIQPACVALSRRLQAEEALLHYKHIDCQGTWKVTRASMGRTVMRHYGMKQGTGGCYRDKAPALAPCVPHPCAVCPCGPHPCPHQLLVWQPLCQHQPAAATNLTACAQRCNNFHCLGMTAAYTTLWRRQKWLQPTRWSHLVAAP